MPLVFIHGVRQRNEDGLRNLEFEFQMMVDRLRSKRTLSDAFNVRVPYWGELGAAPQSLDIIAPAYDAGAYESAAIPEVAFQRLVDLYGGDLELLRNALHDTARNEGLTPDELAELDQLLRGDLRDAYGRFLAQPQPMRRDFESNFEAVRPRSVIIKRNALQWFGDTVLRGVTSAALTVPVVLKSYSQCHHNFALFVGDAMAYVIQRERGGVDSPILKAVLEVLPESSTAEDPLIVVTHSMGGTIFYDILTSYRPGLEVACWFSVGSQVAQFHSLGFFANQRDRKPGMTTSGDRTQTRATGLKPRVKHWFNLYDPLDPLNFVASTVFADAEDVQYRTARGPMSSHSWYFREQRFYELLTHHLLNVLGPG